MTAYFDAKCQALQRFGLDVGDRGDLSLVESDFLKSFEEDLVNDVDRATGSPGFPEDLARDIDKVILARCVYSQPVNRRTEDIPSPETPREHLRLLYDLVGDLHTLFHELVKRRVRGFSDDPRTPLRVLQARSEERRERVVDGHPAVAPCDVSEERIVEWLRRDGSDSAEKIGIEAGLPVSTRCLIEDAVADDIKAGKHRR